MMELNKLSKLPEDLDEIKLYIDIEELQEEIKSKSVYEVTKVNETTFQITESINVRDLTEDERTNFKEAFPQTCYFARIQKDSFFYIGYINAQLFRENFGINFYSNGDCYVGYWNDNKKQGRGFYTFAEKEGISEVYMGEFSFSKLNNVGIYFWLTSSINLDYGLSTFDAQLGYIIKEKFVSGLYLNKSEQDIYVYYGKFSESGLKTDNSCMFYDSVKNRSYFGSIREDLIEKGYLISIKEKEVNNEEESEGDEDDQDKSKSIDDGNNEAEYEVVYIEMEDNTPVSCKKDDEIELEEKENCINKSQKLKKILCFGNDNAHVSVDYIHEFYKRMQKLSYYSNLVNVSSLDSLTQETIKQIDSLLSRKQVLEFLNLLEY